MRRQLQQFIMLKTVWTLCWSFCKCTERSLVTKLPRRVRAFSRELAVY
ncbi:hypothetical protein A6R68_05962 [Neotoma lepida]|uniref:SOCS box domain-containing protein n=1 Tax=Neotoma lepida TaxID=56216 RepID=A0A1A6GGV1_NEOLE|nr:hypothetical protein A6R68_05962 [Neotoma lepida]